MKGPAKHVELLDHIRGIAIIAVLLFHTLGNVYGYNTLPWGAWLRDFSVPTSFLCFLPFSFGQEGVAIFFVVSGFCIHLSFHQQGRGWGHFFIRRFFRIYPPYLAALIFSVLLFGVHSQLDFHSREFWMQLSTHLFLIHNCFPLTFAGFNGSLWSLAVEAQLYLLYPALLVLVAKLGWRRTMMILAAVELLIRGLDGLVQTAGAADTIGGHVAWFLASSPLGYWFSWAIGAYIADAFLKKQPLPFAKASPIWWLALAIVSYFVKPLDPFGFLLFAVTTAVVTSKLLSRTAPKIKAPAFSSVLLGKIGLWSYSLYLLHEPLLQIYATASVRVVPEEYRSAPITLLIILTTWLAIIPFSILWYKLFELPGIALGKRIIRKMAARNGATVAPGKLPAVPRSGWYGFCLMAGALVVMVVGTCWISAKSTPRSPEEINNLAWSLATNPDAAKRNGLLAIKLAEAACQQTHYQNAVMIGTLAAAYAEAGRFDDAILTAQRCNTLATQSNEQELLNVNQKLLALYLKHQPYHVNAPQPSNPVHQ